jgi:hypothetical protein
MTFIVLMSNDGEPMEDIVLSGPKSLYTALATVEDTVIASWDYFRNYEITKSVTKFTKSIVRSLRTFTA